MAFPNGWTRSCPMVIQHGQVTGSLTDYPVAITHDSFIANCPEILTTGDANAAQADGGDLRFSSDVGGCVQLPCEVVEWVQNATPSLATAEIHVGGTAPDSAGNFTVYAWWKAGGGKTQPAVTDPFGAQAVWPSSHQTVNHFGDSSTLSGLDSTGKHSDFVNYYGPSACVGKLGGGINYTAHGQQVELLTQNWLRNVSQITLSIWVKVATYGTQGMCMFNCGPGAGGGVTDDILMMVGGPSTMFFQLDNGVDGSAYYTFDPRGAWHQFVLVFDGAQSGNANRLKVYADGIQQSLAFSYTVPATTGGSNGCHLNFYNDNSWSAVRARRRIQGTKCSAVC